MAQIYVILIIVLVGFGLFSSDRVWLTVALITGTTGLILKLHDIHKTIEKNHESMYTRIYEEGRDIRERIWVCHINIIEKKVQRGD